MSFERFSIILTLFLLYTIIPFLGKGSLTLPPKFHKSKKELYRKSIKENSINIFFAHLVKNKYNQAQDSGTFYKLKHNSATTMQHGRCAPEDRNCDKKIVKCFKPN